MVCCRGGRASVRCWFLDIQIFKYEKMKNVGTFRFLESTPVKYRMSQDTKSDMKYRIGAANIIHLTQLSP